MCRVAGAAAADVAGGASVHPRRAAALAPKRVRGPVQASRIRGMGRRVSETPATRQLRQAGVEFSEHVYDYVDHGGAGEAARQLGLPLPAVVKTLVMQDERALPLVVLMHGDREVSTKNLARAIGRKSVQACTVETAQRHSGYQVGGTSPFGLRKRMPVYVERGVLALERVYLNGGRRGYLVGIDASVLEALLGAEPVECAQPSS
jgi:Cys-tRNA(Pro) deacylase